MKKHLLLLTFSISLITVNCNAQNNIIDSLQAVLKTEKIDTNKVNTLNELSWQHTSIGNLTLALTNANDALLIAEKINYKIGIATAYRRLGNIYYSQGNFPEALKSYHASLKINQELGDQVGIARSYMGIGITHKNQGNYPEALKSLFVSLKINEELGNKGGIAGCYNNIGNVYDEQGSYPEALKNYFASLKINEEIGNKTGIANAYNNIGIVYYSQLNYPEALKNHFSSLKIKREIGDKSGIASSYNNIGTVYSKQHNYPDALSNYFAALKINEEMGTREGIVNSYANIGMVNGQLKKYNDAFTYLNKALQLSKEIGNKIAIKGTYAALSDLNYTTGNWRGAYENHKMYILYRDSLFNEENTKKTVQTAMNYEFDKKEQATKLVQEKKDALAKQETQKQALIRNSFVGGFATVLLFSIVVFWQRNKVIKEKARSEELLLNILPAEVAEELKEKGRAEAKLINEVTVLFTDFKGFTEYAEKLTPENLVKDIHECFSAFDNIMEKHHMEKIKTIGDAYMAAGGLPSPNITHATDAIEAAFEIINFIDERKKRKEAEGLPFIEIRIGIHTGQVVAGIVGVKKYSYDIWGDTVNTASRMESSGEVGKINISESTYDLVKDKFKCEHRGKIEAKNKGMIDMYFVENA